ncbi:unnamed protein product [Didymodactylos carnosus]|nr:unnamed protein product [Didymodactylos carnosus]CAF3745769.1 unnamed protein product [Didymodactylos carnosus]
MKNPNIDPLAGNITNSIDQLAGNITNSIDQLAGNITNSIDQLAGNITNSIDQLAGNITNSTRHILDYKQTLIKLGLTLILPLAIGQCIQLIWSDRLKLLIPKLKLAKVSSVALLFILWCVFCNAFANKSFERISKIDFLLLITIDIVLYIGFSIILTGIARIPIEYWQFSRKDTVAIVYSSISKTIGMGIPLINALYGGQDAQIVALLALPVISYYIIQLILGSIQTVLFQHWLKRDKAPQKGLITFPPNMLKLIIEKQKIVTFV